MLITQHDQRFSNVLKAATVSLTSFHDDISFHHHFPLCRNKDATDVMFQYGNISQYITGITDRAIEDANTPIFSIKNDLLFTSLAPPNGLRSICSVR